VLVGVLFKKFGHFLNNPRIWKYVLSNSQKMHFWHKVQYIKKKIYAYSISQYISNKIRGTYNFVCYTTI
jgi:hypothetical protein